MNRLEMNDLYTNDMLFFTLRRDDTMVQNFYVTLKREENLGFHNFGTEQNVSSENEPKSRQMLGSFCSVSISVKGGKQSKYSGLKVPVLWSRYLLPKYGIVVGHVFRMD